MGEASPWREVLDEYTGGSGSFKERHNNELVSFLPFVQRFLYGEERPKDTEATAGSPMRVFRRSDGSALRAVLYPGAPPILLDIAHVDLYFFLDVNLVLLNVEVSARNLTLTLTLYTMVKSKRLSDFLDVLSDERANAWQKFKALGLVWGARTNQEGRKARTLGVAIN